MNDEVSNTRDSIRWHRDHVELSRDLRGWFTCSNPEIDYEVKQHWYGYLSNPEGPIGTRLILNIDDPSRVATALFDAASLCAGQALAVWVDDRERWALLNEALQIAGCRPVKAMTHLALVGSLRVTSRLASLHIEDVGDEHLEEWAITKLKCFNDREEHPSRESIAAEMSTRRAEKALAQLRLARFDGEPVGMVAFYVGNDQLVFNLGTRTPFRHLGVAQEMLTRWVHEGVSQNCRSLIINADDPGMPQKLYRRMGFVDEIYWYQRYEFDTVDS